MNTKLLKAAVAVAASLLVSTACSLAQSSAYFNAVQSLGPAGYWPMHEVEPGAAGDIETNYGTLGLLGTGYYPDWSPGGPVCSFKRGAHGALANDTDTAVNFTRGASPGGGTYTNYLYVPHTSPLATLNPPFSVECWFFPTNLTSEDILAQSGDEGLNQGGNSGGNAGSLAGFRLVWMDGSNTGFQIYNLDGTQYSAGFAGNNGGASAYPTNNWYHLVVTCDANTNFSLYVNGNQVSLQYFATTPAEGPGTYKPDYWTPLTIGGGRGGTRACAGTIDEVAVYTNVITDILQHYTNGTSGAVGAYFHDVTNDGAVIYLRMDAPAAYTPPNVSTWPMLANFGTTNGIAVGNGLYTPGTMPGLVTAPIINPNGVTFGGVSNNLAALSGMGTFADAGYAAAFNPTGSNTTFTVTALFRGNPCDNRVQSIVGHGTNSWQLSMSTSGNMVFNAGYGAAQGGTGSAAGDIKTMGVYNDGNWHQVVAVNATNEVWIYVDGVLDTNGTPAGITASNLIPGNTRDVMIGSDPSYTNSPAGAGRSFAGQVCEVAFFTNALASSQIQTLYSNCEVAPFISAQPVTSRAVDGGTGSFIYFGVIAEGAPSLAYQWYFNTTSNYSGATKLVDNGVHYTDSTTLQLTVTNLSSSDSGYYYAVVNNNYGSVTSILASLTVYSAPMLVSQLPITYSNAVGTDIFTNYLTLYAGANPVFFVTNVGAMPIGYQWYSNGVALAGMTGNYAYFTNLQNIGTMNIYCIVTNFVGGNTDLWSASVLPDPTNATGGLAPYPQSVLALNPIGYWRMNDASEDGADNGSGDDGYICHDYAGGNDGIFTNCYIGQTDTYSPASDPSDTSAQFGEESSFDFGDSLAFGIAGINFGTPAGTGTNFTVEAWVSGYEQNYDAGIVTLGYGDGGEQFDLDTGSDGGSPSHAFRFLFRDASGTTHAVSSSIVTTTTGQGPWYHLAGVVDEVHSNISFYINGRLVGTTAVSPTAGVLSSSYLMDIGSRMGGQNTNYNFQFLGNINDVAVYNYALSMAQIQQQYSSVGGGISPYFTQATVTATNATAGQALVISPPLAAGTPVLGYYWYDVSGGTNVAAGTTNGDLLSAGLTVTNVPGTWNNDTLELFVTNAYGTTNLSVALTIYTNIQITENIPAQVDLVSGESYTYAITAVGAMPVGFQWYQNGAPLAGQTGPTYTATAGSPGSTTYYVVITNAYGAVTSAVSTFTSVAQLTNSYETSFLQFHPVDYWPLQETNTPAPAMIETNYGSLGPLGNAYYAATNPADVLFGQPGLPGGNNTSVKFLAVGAVTGDSFAFVPRLSPSVTLQPPFTMELWLNGDALTSSSHSNTADLLSEEGSGLDSPPGDGNFGGARMSWVYDSTSAGPGVALLPADGNGGSIGDWEFPVTAADQWYHYVVTYDGTNFIAFVNGAPQGTNAYAMAPDTWTPLTIGCGRWQATDTRAFNGFETEVAVYTNVLSDNQITNDYLAGITIGSNYAQTVLNDDPLLYYQMNCPGYTNLSPLLCPVAVDYGSDPQDGYYASGTMPGEMAGPPIIGLNAHAPAINGITSCINVNYSSFLNPTGTQPFTAMAWFKSNPSDGRMQTIMSHGGNTSWALNLVGTNGTLSWSSGAGSVASTGTFNDGNWHFAAGVYNGLDNYLYVDGSLNNSSAASGSITGNTSDGVFLGGDPDFTLAGGNQRYFAGTIAQAAFFTNALTAAQIQQIYNTATVSVNPNPTNIVFFVTNSPNTQLVLSWPADHIGWQLQAQTNSLSVGINTNWVNVSGSTATNVIAIPINLTKGTVFYRLMYQP